MQVGPIHPPNVRRRKDVAAIGAQHAPVVVMGDIVVDIVIKPDGAIRMASDTDSCIRLGLGGAGANMAVNLARLGVHTVFVGRIGDDELGRVAMAALQQEANLTPAVEPLTGVPTGAIAVLVDEQGQRTMFPQRGANKHLNAEFVARRWPEEVRGLFVSGYALFDETTRAAARAAMERARPAGVPIAVDPASYANILDVGVERFLDWCRDATIILPNRHEAAVLARSDDPGHNAEAGAHPVRTPTPSAPQTPPEDDIDIEHVLTRLGKLFPTVVVKLDRDGATARSGDETAHAPAHNVPVVDTTGAGDAFNAGFFAAYLAGRSLAEAVAAGNARAARVVQHVGAS